MYEVVSETGPQHAKLFEIRCSLIELSTGTPTDSVNSSGTSHIRAKQTAAELMLKQTKLQVPTAEQIKKKRAGKLPFVFKIKIIIFVQLDFKESNFNR